MDALRHGGERLRRLDEGRLSDAGAAKSVLSDRYFARFTGMPPAPPFVRQRIDTIQQIAESQIHAIGVGRKEIGGESTNTVCVRVYVTQKLPHSRIDRAARVPQHIDGIPTDVVEASPAYLAMPIQPCSLARRARKRPIRPGTSIGNEAVAAGTLAIRCVSLLPTENGRRLLLSNSHVLSNYGAAAIGSAIYQPAPADGGTPLDLVARLLRFEPVIEDVLANNLVDAAVAEIVSGIAVGTEICTVGAVNGVADAVEGMEVHKHARTTGYSIGIVDDLACDVLVPVSRADPARRARFINQIRIRARTGSARFAQFGDSGALVVSKAGNRAVGLLFACPDDGAYAYANPIRAVLDRLAIELN